MRAIKLLVLGLFFVLTAFSANAAELRLEKGPADNLAKLQLGNLEFWAIQDSPGEMGIDLFKGPLSMEQREALLPSGAAAASINVFMIKSPDQVILVDTGLGTGGDFKGALLDLLKAAQISPEAVDSVLLTHLHFDHCGGLLKDDKPAFPNATVYVSRLEQEFWTNPDLLKGDSFFKDNAQLVKKIYEAYGDRIWDFEFVELVGADGITSLDATGHTPGHTAFTVFSSEEDQGIIIVGDILHGAAIQFAYPDENTEYDMDQAKSPAARKAILSKAAKEKLLVAGMHIPWPGIGYVREDDKGGFVFTPIK